MRGRGPGNLARQPQRLNLGDRLVSRARQDVGRDRGKASVGHARDVDDAVSLSSFKTLQ